MENPGGQGVKDPGKELTLQCKKYYVTKRLKTGLSEAIFKLVLSLKHMNYVIESGINITEVVTFNPLWKQE